MASFRYALRDGVRLIFRHWGLSFLTVFTSMAVFFLIGCSVLFVLNARHAVGVLEGELSIQAYVRSDADLDALAAEVRTLPYTKAVKIVTSDMALEKLRARLGNQAQALMLLGENPLPPSLEIRVNRASDVADTAKFLMTLDVVQDVVYAGKLADRLAKLSRFAEQFSLIVLLVAVTASGVVLFNTIRIAVYSKEEEIGIMLMVGATPTFVALPFTIQGMFLGSAGAMCASMLLILSYRAVIVRLKDLMPFMPLIENSRIAWQLGFMLTGAGATLSLVASLLAVERFIRRALKPL